MTGKNSHGLYPYEPSLVWAFAAIGVFGLSALVHTIVVMRKRTWFYACLLAGAWMMTAGYAFRILSSKSPDNLILYILQSLFIILPPSLYAATIYMIYGRIALFVRCPQASLVAPGRITKIFVIGDLFAFLLQAGGGGMMAMEDLGATGQKIVLGGLAVQILFFGFFLVVSVVFLARMRAPGADNSRTRGRRGWRALFAVLLVASAVILGRCVFRIIEFAQGHNGPIASDEKLIYLFDAVPMAAVQVLFHLVHAGDVFTDRSGFTSFDDETEMGLIKP